MKIKGFLKETVIDFPGVLSSVIFTYGCNYICPACHGKKFVLEDNGQYVQEEEILEYLKRRKKWIDGVVISGGEPTLQHTLIYFIKDLKKLGLKVKLDTNGSNYVALGGLLKEKLVDYVAMDVKGPPYIYSHFVGKRVDLRDHVEKGIGTVQNFPDHEYRTTVVPVIRKEGISFMTPEEVGDTAEFICNNTVNNDHKYFLQKFVPRKGELIDSRLEEFPETPEEIMLKSLDLARKYLPNTKIR